MKNEKLGLIPTERMVNAITARYSSAQARIKEIALSIRAENFTEILAIESKKKIDSIIGGLNRFAAPWSRMAISLSYREAILLARVSLEVLGAERNPLFNRKIHARTISDYADATLNDLLKANRTIRANFDSYLHLVRQASKSTARIQAFSPDDETKINEIVKSAIENEEARGPAQREIFEYLKEKIGGGDFIRIAGRNYNLRSYAELVARTRFRQAQTDAIENLCGEYDNDLVRFSKHYKPCDDCKQYEGQVFSLSGRTAGYPKLVKKPPIHPNCGHSISPTSEVAIRVRGEFL